MLDGLKSLGNIGAMMKTLQEVGGKMRAMREELRTRRVTGSAGGGLLTVEMNGEMEVFSCRVDPSLLKPEDREMLEDLLVAATNQAIQKAREMNLDGVKSVTGGITLPPGMEQLLNQVREG